MYYFISSFWTHQYAHTRIYEIQAIEKKGNRRGPPDGEEAEGVVVTIVTQLGPHGFYTHPAALLSVWNRLFFVSPHSCAPYCADHIVLGMFPSWCGCCQHSYQLCCLRPGGRRGRQG